MGLRLKEQLSIELTDTELRLLWFIPGKRKNKRKLNMNMTPVNFETVPLSPGIIEQANVRQPHELTRILNLCLRGRGIRGRVKVRIGIPLSNGFSREYSLPWVPERERSQLFSYLADEEIPIPVKERIFDTIVVEDNPSQKRLRVILSGIRKSAVLGISSCFVTAGFQIEEIGFSAIAWARVMNFGSQEHNLIIHEHAGLLQLILYKGQIPEIIRTIPTTLKGLGEAEWKIEIQRTLAYFSTLSEQVKIKQIIGVSGPEVETLGHRLCEYLRQEKEMNPVFHTLEEGVVLEEGLEIGIDNRRSSLAVTGMALDDFPSLSNFYREEIQRKIGQRNIWIAIILLLTFSLAGIGFRNTIQTQISKLEREVKELRVIGEGLTNQGNRQGEKVLAWNAIITNPSTVGKELDQLLGLTGRGIEFKKLEYKEDLLLVQGSVSDPSLVQSVIYALQGLGWERARLISYRQEQSLSLDSGEVEFIVTAEPFKK